MWLASTFTVAASITPSLLYRSIREIFVSSVPAFGHSFAFRNDILQMNGLATDWTALTKAPNTDKRLVA